MKNYTVFDILGPAMIGPSSSLTAGACRLALAAYEMAPSIFIKPPSTYTVHLPKPTEVTAPIVHY